MANQKATRKGPDGSPNGVRKQAGHTGGAPHHEDLRLAARCCAGDESALSELVARLEPRLAGLLVRRGVGATAAQDLVEDLLGDCVAVAPGGSLLAKYSGRSSLDTWLATVLTHRWLDQVRRNRKVQALDLEPRNGSQPMMFDRLAEPALTTLLYEALRQAFDRCNPETFVMLQLVHVHGISQRNLARQWGVSEFKISRRLSQAMRQIQADAMAQLREKDTLLRFEWDDIVDICSAMDLLGPWEIKTGALPKPLQEPGRQSSYIKNVAQKENVAKAMQTGV